MPSTEAYLGSPLQDPETGSWSLQLDSELQISFDSICELVTTIFEASACLFVGNFPDGTMVVSRSGTPFELSNDEIEALRATSEFSDAIVDGVTTQSAENAQTSNGLQRYRIVSPVLMPSGLRLGWLVFFRVAAAELSIQEKAILRVLHRDITNHLLHSKQVFEAAKSQGLQTLISENNEDWIFVKDEQFRIVYANEAFLDIYPEDKRDRIIGYTTVEEYEKAEADNFLTHDRVAFEEGISKVIEDLHMPDGRHRIVETVKRRFEDQNGKRYILCICRDITEREDLIRELKKANDELGYFTSIASHDLKSPLNAIRRLLEWIQEDCAPLIPDEHAENMRLVVNRADRMQALLDDLLTYARIGREDASSSDINLQSLYEDINQLLDIPDSFSVSVPDQTLHLPAVPFKTVMLNLIGNAIKHNDKEHGTVDVSVDESRHHYLITVKDNGPGIDPKYFDRIFQLFQTLKPRDEVEGSGIGLSVVMKYITSFGGKIDVESDGVSGTSFKISWPKRVSTK